VSDDAIARATPLPRRKTTMPPPDDLKLSEFRERNIALLREVDDLKTQIEANAADRAKFAELMATNPSGRISALEAELANEKTARIDVQKRADALVIEKTISDAFLRVGGVPKARGYIVAQGASQFILENGELKGTTHSPARPGEPMSVDEWLLLQTRENSFCFLPSSGGGADKKPGGSRTGVPVIRDPSPQDLGKHAKDIAAGRVRIEYST
jgi:hypothetical protein